MIRKQGKKGKKQPTNIDKSNKFISRYWIVLLLILMLAGFLWINSLNPVLMWDENVFLGNARSHISTSNFTEDFRSPLLEYIIAGVWLVTGESIFIAKLTIMLFNLGSILVFYLISKKLFKNHVLPTLLFALSSEFVFWSFRVYGDSISLFFILLSFYLFTKKKNLPYAFSGLFAAVAFLTRFPLALLAVAIGIYCLIKRKWKPLILFCAGFFVGIIPWLIYNTLTYKNPLWDVFALFAAVDQYTSPQPASLLLLLLLKSLFVLVFFLPLGLYRIVMIGKEKGKEEKNRAGKNKEEEKKKYFDFWLIIIIYLIISLAYYLFFVKLKLTRYTLVTTPFIILICYLGIAEFFKLVKMKKATATLVGILILIIMLIPLNISLVDIQERGICNRAVSESLNYINQNTEPGETILGNEWVGYGYIGNLKAFSVWDPDIDMLIELYQPSYMIYHTKGGIEYNLTTLENSMNLLLELKIKGECSDIYIFKNIFKNKNNQNYNQSS